MNACNRNAAQSIKMEHLNAIVILFSQDSSGIPSCEGQSLIHIIIVISFETLRMDNICINRNHSEGV
jgi:hypothetical protein